MNSSIGPIDPYDYRLVALSVFVSVLFGFIALSLAAHVQAAQSGVRRAWLLACAAAMGAGITSAHYIGMEAFRAPVRVQYGWATILLTLFVSTLASAIAFSLVSSPVMGISRLVAASLTLAAGISAAHYIGLDAMPLGAMHIHSGGMIFLSIALAFAISLAALQLTFDVRQPLPMLGWRKFTSAVILGLAVPFMHYVGMGTVRFIPGIWGGATAEEPIGASPLGITGIAIATLTMLGLVFLLSMTHRRSSLRAQQLADNEARLQTIFDSLTEGILVLDRAQKIVQMNQTALTLFGLKEWIGSIDEALDAFELFLPTGERVEREQRPVVRALRNEFVQNQEFGVRAKATGNIVTCSLNSAPISNRSGELVQVLVSFRDITEQKQLDEARTRLAAIVESSEDAIIGKNIQGIVTSWNKGAERIFGYSAEEMIGHSIRCLLPPSHEYEEDEIIARILRGEIVEHIETLRRRKNGQLFHASLTISPIRDANNKVIGASKIARDIDDKKQMERQMRQSQKMEAIGQLTGGIAHDFNNLLGVIVGNLDLLERLVGENDTAIRRVQTAQKAAARGADLTRRLLAFSSREELNPAPVRLEESIQNMIDLAGHAIGPEIVVVTHFDKTVPLVFVDAAGLESALLNLVVNARDAMPKGGSLTIGTKLRELETSYPPVVTGEIPAGIYACVSVSDTGHGMSPETLERAFEPFFTTKPRNKGTGLGLAMVYGFIKQSKGTVRLYSELGYGTTVSLYLPLAANAVAPAHSPAKTAHSPNHGGKVLVVDDEAALLEIATAYLAEMGYTALQAEDAVSALEVFSQHSDIDLIVTDIIMPGGVNGMELAQKIRALNPATRVIFTSGFPADALAERSGTKVEGPLLQKPYQRAEFTSIVRRVMEDRTVEIGPEALLAREENEPGTSGSYLEK